MTIREHWEAEFEGHRVVVARDEVTKGFALHWDDVEIARRTWSWIGLAELHATADVHGRPTEVRVAIQWGGIAEHDGRCTIDVDGKEVAVVHVD